MDRSNLIYTEDGRTLEITGSVNELEQQFRSFGFVRCHQSFLVNLSKVNVLSGGAQQNTYYLTVHGSTRKIPVSRTRYMDLVKTVSGRCEVR